MKTVNIAKEFHFTHADGRKQHFKPGAHEVDDRVAEHWYVQAHSDNPPPPEVKVGTPEYVQQHNERMKRQKILDSIKAEEFERNRVRLPMPAHGASELPQIVDNTYAPGPEQHPDVVDSSRVYEEQVFPVRLAPANPSDHELDQTDESKTEKKVKRRKVSGDTETDEEE